MSKKEIEHDTLGNRLKSYEYISTSRQLMHNTPVYARIDGRAFHTFCRGLEKPFSRAFIKVMQETCKFLVEETNACLGYVQSDEISLGWENIVKAPFDGRVQKLESNLASLASSKFVHCIESFHSGGVHINDDIDRLWHSLETNLPSFDCRVFNVPSMMELANSFLWRENDAIKNSITGMALNFYSHNELQGKNSDEKIHMMRMKGYCFYEDTEEAFLRGTFWHRENYLKVLTKEEVARIPEKQRVNLLKSDESDALSCYRTRIAKMDIPYRLTDIENKVDVLFFGAPAVLNKENPTFDLSKRGI